METLLKSRVLPTALLIFIAFCAGCASTQKSPSTQGQGDAQAPLSQKAVEIYGPNPQETAPTYGPDPVSIKPVVLVLGPGMARSFAYVGVLRALADDQIPVAAIVGTEMGALFGSLYAIDPNINHFEWSVLKFRDEDFAVNSGLISGFLKGTSGLNRLEADLDRAFSNKDINESKIPLKIGIQVGENPPQLLERGRISEVVRAAIADSGIYPAGTWEGGPASSTRDSRPFPVIEAKALGLGPVVVVDVSNGLAGGSDLGMADLILRPRVKAIGDMEFQKRTDASFRGKAEVRAHLDELRHLVGLPKESGN